MLRFRIERAALPVGAAGRDRQHQRAERPRPLADDRRREDRPELVARRELQRFGLQLRREVDQVVYADTPCRSNAGGLVGNGCVGEYHSPGTSPFVDRPLLDRPDRLAGHAIEHVEPALLGRLRDAP